jgi:hypothetical protein
MSASFDAKPCLVFWFRPQKPVLYLLYVSDGKPIISISKEAYDRAKVYVIHPDEVYRLKQKNRISLKRVMLLLRPLNAITTVCIIVIC